MPGKPIRVANITEEGRYSGPPARIAAVAEKLNAQGIETWVFYPRRISERLANELQARGVSQAPMSLHRLTLYPPDLLMFVLLFPYEVWRLYRALRERRIDIVHCNGSWQWKGMLAAKLAGIPAIWHLNDTGMPRPIRWIFRIIASRCATAFIVAAKRTGEYYLAGNALSTRPCTEIQAPVDCRRLNPENVAPAAQITALAGPRILSVGNVNPLKDFPTLIRAAVHLRDRFGLQPSIVIVGYMFDSQKRHIAEIESLIRTSGLKNIRLLGPTDDVAGCLAAVHLYVCSSRLEASPMAVWEALAMGLPVVSTDVGDVQRLNEKGRFGSVVPVGDAEAMAEAIQALLADAENRAITGQRARKFALEQLDLDLCVRRHAEVYQSLGSRTR